MSAIRDIEAFPVWIGHRNQLLVKVTTEDGLYGWGESGFSGRERAVMGAVEHFREVLRGRDAMRIGALWQELYRSQYFEGGRVLAAAISAIDIALHDIKGKAVGVPVYELLGGRQRDRVPLLASTVSSPGQTMIEEALAYIADGFQAIRLTRGSGRGAAATEDLFEPRLASPRLLTGSYGRARRLGPLQFLASISITGCLCPRPRAFANACRVAR
jgi:galactonate dehydratase